jgi:phosphate transport system substrate-binding protein
MPDRHHGAAGAPPRRALLAAGLAALAAPRPLRAAPRPRLVLTGNGGAITAARIVAEAFAQTLPDLELEHIATLGTAGGIAATLAGVADVALAARHILPDEAARGAQGRAYARTPLAFATHPQVPLRDISLDQAAGLYAGSVVSWADGSPVRAIRRPGNDTQPLALAAASPAMAQAMAALQRRQGVLQAASDIDSADTLEQVRGAFGVIALGQALAERRRVTLLTLDGVPAETATMEAGRYPLALTLRAVTRATPSAAAARFLDFLGSAEGAAILAMHGHAGPAGEARA